MALWVLAAIVLAGVIGAVWLHQVMAGDRDRALEAWQNDAIEITDTETGIVMEPASGATSTGLVFVPGAKVDPYAYLYKLSGIVENGTTVVITKPTLNLAFADLRPLDAFTTNAPRIDEWFVGGHSLGGVKSCQYASDTSVAGLVFFGSYCATDLSGTDLPVLSYVAQNDGLSTPQNIEDAAGLLPADTITVELPGANHADFGDYGVQPGDGESTVDDSDVRDAITDEFQAWLDALEP
ncbi:alpha/beta hydrolase [Mycetocola zhujimingii]|uniref:alpha/beta hydrolase n=1 Tax=Mycetocola zhujimingii TaxID=2079792 RepID=UPI001E3CFD8A|nr:alpha/beta hydrolase [Mycetocola zhujimingii]